MLKRQPLIISLLGFALFASVSCSGMNGSISAYHSLQADAGQEPMPTPQPVPQPENPTPAPQPNPPAEPPSQKPGDGKDPDLQGPETLKPTVYYFVTINENEKLCEYSETVDINGASGTVLLRVCQKTWSACAVQGTCAVIQGEETHFFNVIGKFEGQTRFFEIDRKKCRFGYGVNNICLDPFYSVAADLTIHKPGDVIFIPAVVGLELPDGSKHDGYFIVRDQGHGIVGPGRFDFFSGMISWYDSKNPFKKLGLGDVKTNIPYFKVTGEKAKKALSNRAYPSLPPESK